MTGLGNRPKTKEELLELQADYLRKKPERLSYIEVLYLNLYDLYLDNKMALEKLQNKDKKPKI